MNKMFPFFVLLLLAAVSDAYAQKLPPVKRPSSVNKPKIQQPGPNDAETLQAAKDKANPKKRGQSPAGQGAGAPATPGAGK